MKIRYGHRGGYPDYKNPQRFSRAWLKAEEEELNVSEGESGGGSSSNSET